MKCILKVIAIGAAALTLSACGVAHVNNFKFDVSPSPEVRGAGTYLKSSDATLRASVAYASVDEDEVTMPVRSRALDESLESRLLGESLSTIGIDSVGKFESNQAILKLDGHHVMGSLDAIFKFNTMFLQIGIGAYDGFYYFASIGANHRFYEWGIFLGEFHQFTTVDYFGYWCSVNGCTDEDLEDSFTVSEWQMLSDTFLGAYFGVHLWRFSLNNTISFYVPGLDVAELDYDMPAVFSNYTSLGIRLGDHWTLRGGTVVTFIRKITKPHLGLKFSIDYTIGTAEPPKKPETTQEYDSRNQWQNQPESKTETVPVTPAEKESATQPESAPDPQEESVSETQAESAPEQQSDDEPESQSERVSEENSEEESESQPE